MVTWALCSGRPHHLLRPSLLQRDTKPQYHRLDTTMAAWVWQGRELLLLLLLSGRAPVSSSLEPGLLHCEPDLKCANKLSMLSLWVLGFHDRPPYHAQWS